MTNRTCPIWRTPATFYATSRDGLDVDSARAGGRYFISRTAQVTLDRRHDDAIRARLTTWLIDQRNLGNECPEVMTTVIDDAERRRDLTVQERLDRLLRFFADQQRYVGDPVRVDMTKAVTILYEPGFSEVGAQLLAHTESTQAQEGAYLIEQLRSKGLLDFRFQGKGEGEYLVTVDGYNRIADLQNVAVDSKQAFVAMWFDDSMMAAYEHGIAPAIDDAGYDALRIDRKEHVNKIDDEIIAEVRRSRFLIADFTQGESGARGGVYYEAGFAHGLSIPVIFTCRQDAIDKVHFDTRQYNHIAWHSPDELRGRLAKRIGAVIGEGSQKG